MASHYLGIRHYLGVFGVCKSMAVLNKNILATSGYKIPPTESATDALTRLRVKFLTAVLE